MEHEYWSTEDSHLWFGCAHDTIEDAVSDFVMCSTRRGLSVPDSVRVYRYVWGGVGDDFIGHAAKVMTETLLEWLDEEFGDMDHTPTRVKARDVNDAVRWVESVLERHDEWGSFHVADFKDVRISDYVSLEVSP